MPKLRFPEFVGYSLQDLQLGDSTAESTERNGSGQAPSQIMGVSKVEGIVPMEERIVAADTARYKVVRKDWFAYNPMRLNIGSIARWQGENDILVSPDYVVFMCKSTGPHRLDPSYLDHFRRSDAWENYVSEKGDGSVRVRIYYKDLARLQLALPSCLEQQKIATCLDSAEELIAAQGRKVVALKAYKKGMMQQLFPQEGETQPRLRFPEFEAAGKWAEVPLSKLVSALDAGVSVNSGDRPAMSYEIGVLKTSAVTNGVFEPLENKVVFDEEEIKRVREPVRADTVILSRMNTPALVGANAYVKDGYPNIFLPDRLWAAKPRPGADMRFVALVLGSDMGRAALSGLAGGSSGSMKNISKPSVLELVVMAPSLPEQQRIADCLTSFDELIAAETRKLNAVKTHKKGLMQQLFPFIEESAS
ncbi:MULTISPECIES: restriction endonuclease subunit S [unclassified Mesorhizobium]|uniref:restriction endonuclease subunit S n=1 Tax=unclassified Mesorhizobium TaxID=325217 RepID=UPI00333C5291